MYVVAGLPLAAGADEEQGTPVPCTHVEAVGAELVQIPLEQARSWQQAVNVAAGTTPLAGLK